MSQTLWLTGLPCSGKTTLAKRLKEEMNARGYNTTHLDGDEIRNKIHKDLGFSSEDRKKHLSRVAHMARSFNHKGIFVIASFVSPTNALRKMVKEIIGDMKLVYVKCNLDECEKRDIKGMYKRARLCELPEFTGISAPFEEPIEPEITVDTQNNSIEECVKQIMDHLKILNRITK